MVGDFLCDKLVIKYQKVIANQRILSLYWLRQEGNSGACGRVLAKTINLAQKDPLLNVTPM